MANNFHSDLPNDQLHNPKDYSTANNSSVLTKDGNGNLDWNTSPYGTSTTITCAGDVSGGLHNKAIYIYWDETDKLEMHFAVTGETASFVPTAGYDQATITIAANDTNITVAAAVDTVLRGLSSPYSFTSSVDGKGKVTFSGMTNALDTTDGTTGFDIQNTKTYTGTTVLTSTSGVLSWQAGGGGGGSINSVVVGAATTSTGDAIEANTVGGAVTVKPQAYAGTTNVGHVPPGGDATTFLRGDGTWVIPTTGSTYTTPSGSGIDATEFAANKITLDGSVVRDSGNQYIGGNKSFFGEVVVPAPSTSDSSSRAVTSQWVNDQNYGTGTVTSITAGTGLTGGTITGSGTIGLDTNIPTKTANNVFTGDNTFAGASTFGDIDVNTVAAGDNSTKAASTAFVTAAVAAGGGGSGGGTVTAVTGTKPINSSGGTAPAITIDRATSSADGYLASSDFSVFSSKQNQISVTTTGTGNATLVGGSTINVPPPPQPLWRYHHRGFVNQSSAGIWLRNAADSSKPFEHRNTIINSSTGVTAQQAIDGAIYVCRAGDKVSRLYGHICGTRNTDVNVILGLFQISCGSGTTSDNFTILGQQTVTLHDPEKSNCIDITANTTAISADDIILIALEKSASGSTDAQYSLTLEMQET